MANILFPRRQNPENSLTSFLGYSYLAQNEPLRASAFLPKDGDFTSRVTQFSPHPSGHINGRLTTQKYLSDSNNHTLQAPPPRPPQSSPEYISSSQNIGTIASDLYEKPLQSIHAQPHQVHRNHIVDPHDSYDDFLKAIRSHPAFPLVYQKYLGNEVQDSHPEAYENCLKVESNVRQHGMSRREADLDSLDVSMAGLLAANYLPTNRINVLSSIDWHANATEHPREGMHRTQLSDSARYVLGQFFQNNFTNPYPTAKEKRALMDQTGLTRLQLDNWFSNRRVPKQILLYIFK